MLIRDLNKEATVYTRTQEFYLMALIPIELAFRTYNHDFIIGIIFEICSLK